MCAYKLKNIIFRRQQIRKTNNTLNMCVMCNFCIYYLNINRIINNKYNIFDYAKNFIEFYLLFTNESFVFKYLQFEFHALKFIIFNPFCL